MTAVGDHPILGQARRVDTLEVVGGAVVHGDIVYCIAEGIGLGLVQDLWLYEDCSLLRLMVGAGRLVLAFADECERVVFGDVAR